MAAGFAGGIIVAAAVALVVTNGVLAPSISSGLSTGDEVAKRQSLPTATLRDLAKVGPTQARMQPDDEPPVPAGTLLEVAPAKQIAAPKSPASPSPTSFEAEPVQLSIARPATAPSSERPATASLTREEIASLLKRSQDLIALGDIARARLILTHLAEAGDAEASFKLAGTFDAAELAKLGVVGVKSDPANAHAWYAKAAEQGSLEAKQRLQQSAIR
jgi:TPR repeat protein